MPQKFQTSKEIYSTNLRMVFSSMINDMSNSGLMKHCAVLEIKHLSEGMYQKYKTVICKAVSVKIKDYQKKSLLEIPVSKEAYKIVKKLKRIELHQNQKKRERATKKHSDD